MDINEAFESIIIKCKGCGCTVKRKVLKCLPKESDERKYCDECEYRQYIAFGNDNGIMLTDKDKCQVCKSGVIIKDREIIKEFGLICEECLHESIEDMERDLNRKRKLEVMPVGKQSDMIWVKGNQKKKRKRII